MHTIGGWQASSRDGSAASGFLCGCRSRQGIRKIRFERRERSLDPVHERGIEIYAVAQIAQEVGDRDAAGFGKEPARGVCAGRVRERRLIASELAEGPLQCCERHDRQLARRSLRFARVISFERCREPLVEPCWYTTRARL